MTEHYMDPYGGYCADPLAFLSAVAAQTSRVRLMTGGIQASFHHPIQLAARTAQLDALSHGRLEVGFARAFLPYEFDAFGVDMDTSTERFRGTVDAVVRLWTGRQVSEDTPSSATRASPPSRRSPSSPILRCGPRPCSRSPASSGSATVVTTCSSPPRPAARRPVSSRS